MENQNKIKLQKSCLIFVVTMALYFLLSVIVSIILQSCFKDDQGYLSSAWYCLISYGVLPISFIVSVCLFSVKDKELVKNLIPRKKIEVKFLPFVIILCFSILFGLSRINEYFIDFLTKTIDYEATAVVLPKKSFIGIFCCIIAVAILPAIFEELLFRKLILDSMKGLPVWFTVLTGGLLFSLFHLNPAQTPYQFIFGCVFVMVVLVTGNVFFTVLMHFINNLTIIVFYYAGWSMNFPIFFTIIALILFALAVSYLIYKLIKNKKESCSYKEGLIIFLPIILCFVIWLGGL